MPEKLFIVRHGTLEVSPHEGFSCKTEAKKWRDKYAKYHEVMIGREFNGPYITPGPDHWRS